MAYLRAEGIVKIGDGAFTNTALESIIIPGSLKSMGRYLCCSCRNLKNVTINEGITEIAMYSFSSCEKLETVRFPKSLTKIGVEAFFNDKNLDRETKKSISSFIRKQKEKDGCADFEYTLYDTYDNYLKLDDISEDRITITKYKGKNKTVVIPSSIEGIKKIAIAKTAFQQKKFIEDIIFPDGDIAIEEFAFSGCTGLSDKCRKKMYKRFADVYLFPYIELIHDRCI